MSNRITPGENWKMQLLTGKITPDEATDVLLDSHVLLSNQQIVEMLLPMAELRAQQIEQGRTSPEDLTRLEAERQHARYERLEAEPSMELLAANLGADASPLAQNIAANWAGKIVQNSMIGELEKELARTVDTYKTEKQENVLRMRHSTAIAR